MLHALWAIDTGQDGSNKGIYHAYHDGTSWSAPFYVASGPFMHAQVASDSTLHVAYMQFHGFVDVGTEQWRNYQGHYRSRDATGSWSDDQQITHEDPVGTLGPVAIHPCVAKGPNGTLHYAYPVDPANPTTAPNEAGHASYMKNEGTSWTSAEEMFPNGTHAAFVDVHVDPAGIVYVVGMNWQKRFRVDMGTGFQPVDFWDTANARWFFRDVKAGPRRRLGSPTCGRVALDPSTWLTLHERATAEPSVETGAVRQLRMHAPASLIVPTHVALKERRTRLTRWIPTILAPSVDQARTVVPGPSTPAWLAVKWTRGLMQRLTVPRRMLLSMVQRAAVPPMLRPQPTPPLMLPQGAAMLGRKNRGTMDALARLLHPSMGIEPICGSLSC